MTEDESDALSKAIIGTAIPVGAALGAFSDQRDALLAVFVFGLTVGSVAPEAAAEVIAQGDEILREDSDVAVEYDRFLRDTNMFSGLLLR